MSLSLKLKTFRQPGRHYSCRIDASEDIRLQYIVYSELQPQTRFHVRYKNAITMTVSDMKSLQGIHVKLCIYNNLPIPINRI